MTPRRKSGVPRIAKIALSLFLLGCATASPRVAYYLLSPDVEPASAATAAETRPPLKVALRPLVLPDLIDRPQIVVRSSEATVEVSEFHRWGGSLKREIARVLAENLNLLLHDHPAVVATDDLALGPDLVLAVQILRFDGRPGGEVTLNTLWTLARPQAAGERLVQDSRIRVLCEAPGYEGLVLAHSRALGLLSREIAAGVRRLGQRSAP
ncbi:MAG: PqiC family protein [Desulfobacterales bacterium]